MKDTHIGAALWAAIFFVYLLFLCPAPYSGDSPLFYTSAFGLGPAHPPGYPLYVFLGKLFTLIPIGSIAYKMNLFSALCGSATSLLVYLSVDYLTGNKPASIFSALLSAFAPLAWLESTKAEVYTLNSLFIMSIFYLCLLYIREGYDARALYAASFLLGLGMGNHQTVGFMVFPIIASYLLGPVRNRVLVPVICALLFTSGMAVYMFGYVRSIKYTGEGILFMYSDSSTWKGFISTFFRKEYDNTLLTVAVPVDRPDTILRGPYNVARYLLFTNMGFYSLIAAIAIPFLARSWRTLIFSVVALASFWVGLASMVFSFKAHDRDLFILNPYMLPLIYMFCVYVGVGIHYALKLVASRAAFALRPISVAIVLLPLVTPLPGTLRENDLSGYYLVEDFADNLADSLPPQSAVISGSDASYFPVFYKSLVERRREDFLLILGGEQWLLSQVNPPWRSKILFPDLASGRLFSEVKESHIEGGSLFAYDIIGLVDKIKEHFVAEPYIHTYRLFPKDKPPDAGVYRRDFERAFDMFVYERALGERASDLFSTELRMGYFMTLSHYAYLLEKEGLPNDKYIAQALDLISREGLSYYMTYLDMTGARDEVRFFVNAIEPKALKYPEVRRLSDLIKKEFL